MRVSRTLVMREWGKPQARYAAAEVAWFRRACRSPQGLPMAVSCVRVPTRNGETEQTRRRIVWSVLRELCEGKP